MSSHKQLPIVYQVELTNACNLKCPMCLRTTDMVRDDRLLDLDLLRIMHGRGEFEGTTYIELQMAGEPTLHPKLHEAIRFLREEAGLLVGLSTHGLTIGKKRGVLEALLDLDSLTISVDSVVPATYARMRPPGQLHQLLSGMDKLFAEVVKRKQAGAHVPFVELQVIRVTAEDDTGDLAALDRVVSDHGWSDLCITRVMEDSFDEMQGRVALRLPRPKGDMCINPWMSVSVTCAGDVVSCCYVFDPKPHQVNVFGNLFEDTLLSIWNGEKAQALREQLKADDHRDYCQACRFKSPALIHDDIVGRLVRIGSKRAG